jgi:hypothetical protein
MHKQHDAIRHGPAAQNRGGFHHLANVDLRGLSLNCRDGGTHTNVVIDSDQFLCSFPESGLCEKEGGDCRNASNWLSHKISWQQIFRRRSSRRR